MNLHELILKIYKSFFVVVLFFLATMSVNAQAPSNDDCSGAILLNVDTVCHYDTFNNYNATASVGVPSPGCGFYQGGDVWFKATVPSSGNIRVEVRGITSINAQFAIYTDSCAALTWYSCNQLNPDRTISDPALAGKDIYIRVYKYNSATGGIFRICVWEPPVPINNNCADAIMLNVDTSCNKVSYTSKYSTGQPTSVAPNPSCGFYQGGDVWFKFIMPASGNIRFELTGDAPQYAIYKGSCGSFSQVLCAQLNYEKTYIDTSLAGDTLYLRVYRYNSEEGGDFDVCVWEPTIPVNNNCTDPIMLNVDTVCNSGLYSNAYATGESTTIAPNPTCGFYQGGDVWFKFVAPASGIFRVEAKGFGMNPQYAVFSGSCGAFSQIMCAQLDAGKTVINPSVGGDTLTLRVWNYNTEEGGNFEICVWEPEIPVNDDCADAIMLDIDTVCNMVSFTNAYASAEPTSIAANPSCGFYKGGDIWFKFVMPASGNLRVEKQNAGANAQYAVYSGNCGSFSQLFCAQLDAGKTYIDSTVVGDTLYLRVWNYNVDEGGGFQICVWDPPIPVNNNCANAIPLTVGSACVPNNYTNRYATNETTAIAPNPSCGFYKGGDVWFTLQMPASGKLTINRQNISGVNAQFALYSGSCGSFTQLACAQLNNTMNYNDTSIIGQTLYLRVWNYNVDEGGEFSLCAYDPSPIITMQPTDTSICLGESAGFTIVATNATSYQWQENDGNGWVDITNGGVYGGATTAMLSLSAPTVSMSSYEYRCIATGTVSPAAISIPASLTVGTAPQFTLVPTAIIGYATISCNTTINYAVNVIGVPAPSMIYNLSGATTGAGNGNGSGNSFNVGNTTVTLSLWNQCDSVDTTFVITVLDTLKPVVTCGQNITISTDNGLCTASGVILSQPTASDACGIDTVFNNAPSTYSVGTTQVLWTVADNNGNISTCKQNVTVIDTTKPIITCPANITVNADNGACFATSVNLGTPTVSDNCATFVTNNAPSSYPVGTTNVLWTATDSSGNSSSCTQTVTVVDNQPPVVLCKNYTLVLSNGTGSIVVSDIDSSSSDNCGIASKVLSKTSFITADIGTNNVTLTVTDVNGNISTCTGVVTVVGGNTGQLSCNITSTPSNNIYTGGNPNNIYLGYGPQTVTLTGVATGGSGYSYLWSGSGLSCTTCQSPTVVPTVAGTYVFTLTVTDNTNASTTCSISLCVKDIRVPGKKNNKVYLCHNGNTLSISKNAVSAHLANHSGDVLGNCNDNCNSSPKQGREVTPELLSGNQYLKIYPNPNNGTFNVQLSTDVEAAKIIVHDLVGKIVLTKSISNSSNSILNLSDIADGMYLVEVRIGNDIYRERVVIKR
ncbi:MAG: HYR domain-containing protein [Flavipsychrobacter sp.]